MEGSLEQPRAEAALGVSLVAGKTGDERGADLLEVGQAAVFAAGQLGGAGTSS